MALKEVKNITKVNWSTVGSVAVGIAVFGAVMYLVKRAPSNAITEPVKSAASAIQ